MGDSPAVLFCFAGGRPSNAEGALLAALAGLLAGNAAGVKYTGWIVPIAICAYLAMFFRRRVAAVWLVARRFFL